MVSPLRMLVSQFNDQGSNLGRTTLTNLPLVKAVFITIMLCCICPDQNM